MFSGVILKVLPFFWMVLISKYDKSYVLYFVNAKNQVESVPFITLECFSLVFF